MPNVLLARYFQGHVLFGDLNFSAMKEGKPDELSAAWLTLPEPQRDVMNAIPGYLRHEFKKNTF